MLERKIRHVFLVSIQNKTLKVNNAFLLIEVCNDVTEAKIKGKECQEVGETQRNEPHLSTC